MSPRSSNAGQPTGVRVSGAAEDLDLEWVHRVLSERAYWALGRSRETVERSIAGSLCFGAYDETDGRQLGFARVITDQATFGWVCDVFVDESARRRGIGNLLIAAISADPRLTGTRLVLASRDARSLYARHGFVPLRNPERWMERPRVTPAPDGGGATGAACYTRPVPGR